MRLRKEPAELAWMREAIAIACEAHREAMRSARPGMHEYEIEALIDFTFRRRHGPRVSVDRRRREERDGAPLHRQRSTARRRRAAVDRRRRRTGWILRRR